MPKCQPAEIHSRDANLQYSVKKMHIYRNIRLCPKQGSTLSSRLFSGFGAKALCLFTNNHLTLGWGEINYSSVLFIIG